VPAIRDRQRRLIRRVNDFDASSLGDVVELPAVLPLIVTSDERQITAWSGLGASFAVRRSVSAATTVVP